MRLVTVAVAILVGCIFTVNAEITGDIQQALAWRDVLLRLNDITEKMTNATTYLDRLMTTVITGDLEFVRPNSPELPSTSPHLFNCKLNTTDVKITYILSLSNSTTVLEYPLTNITITTVDDVIDYADCFFQALVFPGVERTVSCLEEFFFTVDNPVTNDILFQAMFLTQQLKRTVISSQLNTSTIVILPMCDSLTSVMANAAFMYRLRVEPLRMVYTPIEGQPYVYPPKGCFMLPSFRLGMGGAGFRGLHFDWDPAGLPPTLIDTHLAQAMADEGLVMGALASIVENNVQLASVAVSGGIEAGQVCKDVIFIDTSTLPVSNTTTPLPLSSAVIQSQSAPCAQVEEGQLSLSYLINTLVTLNISAPSSTSVSCTIGNTPVGDPPLEAITVSGTPPGIFACSAVSADFNSVHYIQLTIESF